MALINCLECTKEISDKASTCPHCGAPVVYIKPVEAMPETTICRDCDKQYPFDAQFCTSCGLMNYQKAKFVERQEAKAKLPDRSTPVTCPGCKSTNSFSTTNKGFGLGKAAVGGLLFGPVGLLGGLLGSNKTLVTCIKCGCRWSP